MFQHTLCHLSSMLNSYRKRLEIDKGSDKRVHMRHFIILFPHCASSPLIFPWQPSHLD
ncbi:hypothetical protein M378DRAFT_457883 [Amanita muscaria Koide BX008]|uniref:Uncharacterized protein n=1 Tax=Amanita muscaria (strain Koide BX008) TaxID=946122 RepID=A0A0C2X8S1_AMAMK|nr:hypothetical protein M378DRAFT_457883 [Amanita muscaria Koide BX008]